MEVDECETEKLTESITTGEKPSRTGDVSDMLCESLLSLFEYVDDVTKSFNDDRSEDNEVTEDIVDGRLRETDGFNHNNSNNGGILCTVASTDNNIDDEDLTVFYDENEIDEFCNNSTIICTSVKPDSHTESMKTRSVRTESDSHSVVDESHKSDTNDDHNTDTSRKTETFGKTSDTTSPKSSELKSCVTSHVCDTQSVEAGSNATESELNNGVDTTNCRADITDEDHDKLKNSETFIEASSTISNKGYVTLDVCSIGTSPSVSINPISPFRSDNETTSSEHSAGSRSDMTDEGSDMDESVLDDERTVIVIDSSTDNLDDQEADQTVVGVDKDDQEADQKGVGVDKFLHQPLSNLHPYHQDADRTIVGVDKRDKRPDKTTVDGVIVISDNDDKTGVPGEMSHGDCKLKKRHLSSKADVETTPKRHKMDEIKTPGILSPIENTPSLRKPRGLDGILEETPAVYSKTCSMTNDGVNLVSSTPVLDSQADNQGNVRKVIWRNRSGDKLTKGTNLLQLYSDNDGSVMNMGETVKVDKGVSDCRKVVCKNLCPNEGDQQLNAPDINKNDSVFTSDVRNAHICKSEISINDSSYFAENTTRVEGRFKNVTATISTIDLDLDEDLLLSEDVLGLEGDYEDFSGDEDTLLADDPDEQVQADDVDQQVLSETGETSNVSHYPFNRTVVVKNTSPVVENNVELETAIEVLDHKESNTEILKEKEKVTKVSDHEVKEYKVEPSRKVVDSKVCVIEVSIDSESEDNDMDGDKQDTTIDNHGTAVINIDVQDDLIQGKYKQQNEELSVIHEKGNKTESSDSKIPEVGLNRTINNQTSVNETKQGLKVVAPDISKDQKEDNNKTVKNKDSPLNRTISPIKEMTFIFEDKENVVMEEVKRRWGCQRIPSQEVNLTTAFTYHENQGTLDTTEHNIALLEGDAISCLNFYEGELSTRHQTLKYCSAQQTRNKLQQQKQDMDSMKLMTLHTFKDNCYRRCRFLRRRHVEECEQLKRRHEMEHHNLRYCTGMMPFVKQQQFVQLGINHREEKRCLNLHQKFEFNSLVQELQTSLKEETEQHEQEVAPVEMLISQVESLNKTAVTEKYGPNVMVSLKKRPCKENNYKTSTVEVCLPVVIAQALSHEEDIYNHYYKF